MLRGEPFRPGAECRGRVGGGALKAGVVPTYEACQEGIGSGHIGDFVATQFIDQTVLQCAKETLHATLGLGRLGRDAADAQ